MDEVTSDSVNHLNIFSRSEIMAGLRVMIEPLITVLSLHRTIEFSGGAANHRHDLSRLPSL